MARSRHLTTPEQPKTPPFNGFVVSSGGGGGGDGGQNDDDTSTPPLAKMRHTKRNRDNRNHGRCR